jgi:hypothetical protein
MILPASHPRCQQRNLPRSQRLFRVGSLLRNLQGVLRLSLRLNHPGSPVLNPPARQLDSPHRNQPQFRRASLRSSRRPTPRCSHPPFLLLVPSLLPAPSRPANLLASHLVSRRLNLRHNLLDSLLRSRQIFPVVSLREYRHPSLLAGHRGDLRRNHRHFRAPNRQDNLRRSRLDSLPASLLRLPVDNQHDTQRQFLQTSLRRVHLHSLRRNRAQLQHQFPPDHHPGFFSAVSLANSMLTGNVVTVMSECLYSAQRTMPQFPVI